MMHKMVSMDMNKIMPSSEAISLGASPKSKERKPYYQSVSMPSEMFGEEIPKVGSKHRFEMMGEIKEVRKTENGIEIRTDIIQGKCMGGANKVTDEEFAKMNPKQREEYQKDEASTHHEEEG